MSGPEPTWPSVQPRARPRRRSSAASSDTSPVRSTGSSLPRPHIAPRFQGLDEHRSITSAWKGNSTKFVTRSGHLAYMIRFVLALRSDPSSSRVPLELPPSQERYPAFLLPLQRILAAWTGARFNFALTEFSEVRLLGVLRSSPNPSSKMFWAPHRRTKDRGPVV